jgi:hypothetical protein
MRRHAPAFALALVAGGCSRAESGSSSGPGLTADWIGSDTGRLAASAVAEWCDSLTMLEIRAVRGDTGLAIVLYPVDSIAADSYPVRPPAKADSTPPAAAVAMRWFAETAIEGFRGDNGSVVLDAVEPGGITGRFQANVSSVGSADKLKLSGRFRDLPVAKASRGCVGRDARRDTAAVRPDSGVN